MSGKSMIPEVQLQDRYKLQAAKRAVELLRSGMIIGLGHGSTAMCAVEEIAQLVRSETLKNIVGIPCSLHTEEAARRLGISLRSLNDVEKIDVVIDGADEIDRRLDMLKGRGGAMLREKMVAEMSRRRVYIVDESKVSRRIGTLRPLPVEVAPFGWKPVMRYLESLGASVTLRCTGGGKAATTDQGNYILDCNFGAIGRPAELNSQLKSRAGIVEHGLFLDIATDIIIAGAKGIQHLKR